MLKGNGMPRGLVVLAATAVLVAVFVATPVGAITARTAGVSVKKVKKIAASVFDQKAAALKDSCPAGTLRYAGACFETSAHAATDFDTASRACGDAGRRLPTASELLGLRFKLTLAGTNTTNSEMTSNIFRDGGNFGFITVAADGSAFSTEGLFTSLLRPYRCVAPLANS